MDVDISDILADVSHLPSSYNNASSTSHLLSDSQTTRVDHQLLVRAWTNERCAPSLLPYPTDLMSRTMQRIREQIMRIEDLTSDPAAYRSGALSNGATDARPPSTQNLNLVLSVLQTDLSRMQFLVRSLLRQRLAKMTKHAMFYLTSLNNDTKRHLLSEQEIQFLRNHQALLSDLYGATFLDSLPIKLRKLDDTAGGDRMVEGPDEVSAVFVRCLVDFWDNEDAKYDQDDTDVGRVGLTMRRGEVWVVRWRDVKAGVVKGELELL